MNDVLFWSWYLFSEGSIPIKSYLKGDTIRKYSQSLIVGDQISVLSSVKPNMPEREAIEEEIEEIDAAQVLDSFLMEED